MAVVIKHLWQVYLNPTLNFVKINYFLPELSNIFAGDLCYNFFYILSKVKMEKRSESKKGNIDESVVDFQETFNMFNERSFK